MAGKSALTMAVTQSASAIGLGYMNGAEGVGLTLATVLTSAFYGAYRVARICGNRRGEHLKVLEEAYRKNIEREWVANKCVLGPSKIYKFRDPVKFDLN